MPLQIIRQDITKMSVDAIVNTTNREMFGYSGVDFAVHEAAGAELDAECERLAPVWNGVTAVTSGYNLNCRYIIHTCGPLWQGGIEHEKEKLESCYISCLMAALDRGCETVAFPLISAGVYGYPKDQVLKLAVGIITEFLTDHEMTVYLCVFDPKSYEFSKKLFSDITEYIDDVYVLEHSDNCADKCDFSEPRKERKALRSPSSGKTRKHDTALFTKCASLANECLDDWMKKLDDGFAPTLFRLIDEKGMTDVECYKRANVSRKTFSKIKCDPNYKPSKQTAVAFAIALRLNIHETEDFLRTAGLSLSHSFKFDVIIEYFITHGKYDVFEINEALFEFDQVCLGC